MTEKKSKKFIAYLVTAFLAGSVVTGGICAAVFNGALGSVRVSKEEYEALTESYKRYEKLNQLYEAIESTFYKEPDENKMMEGAYKGLVSGLEDPYSSYMTKKEYQTWKSTAIGEYSGVGITFSKDVDGNFVVISVEKDSPAEEGGIKAGDFIRKVDGKEYEDLDLIGNVIRGERGTDVDITYERKGKEATVTLTREEIVQHSVEHDMLDGGLGYIRISSFIQSTGDDFSKALKSVEEKNAKGLILDLRDNGGGLVDSCVAVADEFLDKGAVVYIEDREGNRMEYSAEDGKTDLKTVVLVNENSASASEILAAALADSGVELVGQTTFGKGVIQSTAELEDGSALKITVRQYFSPDGNAINKKGVKPDYTVKNKEGAQEDAQLEKAKSLF